MARLQKRVTVTLSDYAALIAKAQAAESGMTVAQWIAWLVEAYEPVTEEGWRDDE